MDSVRLHFVDTSGAPQQVELPFAVFHMPKPTVKRDFWDDFDTPIFNHLKRELGYQLRPELHFN